MCWKAGRAEESALQLQLPKTVYATFAGTIDQFSLPRIFQNCAAASQGGVEAVHFLFQSTGGIIGDGISLYNFFRTLPFEMHIYNTGSVQSIAIIAYLGAKNRYVSAYGHFMIHKSYFGAQAGTNAAKLKALAEALVMEDDRIEAILRENTDIPEERWAVHPLQDVTFNAKEAIEFGIAHELREFDVPSGNQIFNI